MNKFHATRTYSKLCGRFFASKAEARRGEELRILERAGAVGDLQYQVKFVLCKSPKVSITVDFAYCEDGQQVYEDTKGVLTRDFRSKMAWLKQLKGIEVKLTDTSCRPRGYSVEELEQKVNHSRLKPVSLSLPYPR